MIQQHWLPIRFMEIKIFQKMVGMPMGYRNIYRMEPMWWQSNRCAEPESIDPAKLFDRFYQADPSRGAGGFGIGLSIARSIAEGHRGTIRAAVSGDTITFTAELK